MSKAPEELFPLILDSVAEGVFTVDEQFRITSLNAEAERITGMRRQEAIGRRCYEVLRGSACQQGCPLRRSIETGETQRDIAVTMLDADMVPIPIKVSTAVMRDRHGTLIGGVEVFRDVSELESLRKQLEGRQAFGDLIGASAAMQDVFRLIADVATAEISVLIGGESGTGKELVARAIHDLSPRSEQPFVTVNCGALPDTLIESELFGYVRGAFTDAHRDKPGRFQQAHGGTLFLDEVGDLSAAFQVKLLRALQEGEVTPLGSTETVEVDVRVISATNRDLGELMQSGTFRQDLYYRLCVVPIHIPPLRERREDIAPLLEHLLPQLAIRTGRPTRQLTPAALAALYDYDYPGNVRELRNILERALVLCHAERIDVSHLPAVVARPQDTNPGPSPATEPSGGAPEEPWRLLKPSERRLLAGSGEQIAATAEDPSVVARAGSGDRPEVRQLIAALYAHQWNRAATARALGISRSTLWRRMKDYGLISSPTGG